ncbi:mitochondrial import inner membrane translocase subunit Tim29-like isoform X1 [Varroa jacobsoni]|uniref:Uncharacterized protein n=1 Tax=Varroa destructor TaxID=109461 RepID=A0A7M7JX61_VARDE|nr:mitochondrial import inner membrane translocase subunit Tim29-like isoform X2 [Varroa destructor]XP_022709587.1 mitochondrial import inner membrane translocase subunit Tim29-like isoform X1 [Varroa jacobsoni]
MAATIRRSITSFREKLNQIQLKIVLPKKWRGGRIEKAVKYFEVVATDYKVAVKDGIVDAKAQPKKAAVYMGAALLTTSLIATNPTKLDFIAQTTAWSNEMAIISKSIRNHHSEEHLKSINGLLNQDRLERYNLIFCSLLVRSDYSPECQLYQAQCSFNEPTYFEIISERLVDIGFFGRWWGINWKMSDYDVNENEFLKGI